MPATQVSDDKHGFNGVRSAKYYAGYIAGSRILKL